MKKIKNFCALLVLILQLGFFCMSCGNDDDKTANAVEICDNGMDDDGDGFTDCDDNDCECVVEICDNGMDDDGDGFLDCEDADCDC